MPLSATSWTLSSESGVHTQAIVHHIHMSWAQILFAPCKNQFSRPDPVRVHLLQVVCVLPPESDVYTEVQTSAM